MTDNITLLTTSPLPYLDTTIDITASPHPLPNTPHSTIYISCRGRLGTN